MSSMTIWNDTDIRIIMVVVAQRCYQHTIQTIMKICWYVEYIFSSSGLLNYTITHHVQLPALELNAGTDCTGYQEVWKNNVSIIIVNAHESVVDLYYANFARMAELAWILLTSARALASTLLPQPSHRCLADRWVVMFWFNACPTSVFLMFTISPGVFRGHAASRSIEDIADLKQKWNRAETMRDHALHL